MAVEDILLNQGAQVKRKKDKSPVYLSREAP